MNPSWSDWLSESERAAIEANVLEQIRVVRAGRTLQRMHFAADCVVAILAGLIFLGLYWIGLHIVR
jgi:hypothetical protein